MSTKGTSKTTSRSAATGRFVAKSEKTRHASKASSGRIVKTSSQYGRLSPDEVRRAVAAVSNSV